MPVATYFMRNASIGIWTARKAPVQSARYGVYCRRAQALTCQSQTSQTRCLQGRIEKWRPKPGEDAGIRTIFWDLVSPVSASSQPGTPCGALDEQQAVQVLIVLTHREE